MPASLLLRNVRPLLPQHGLAAGARAALIMEQGRIRALVPDADARETASAGIAEWDGGGGWLLPGVTDAHFHLLGYASSLVSVDCGPDRVHSIADIQARLREAAARTPPGRWVRAWGYSDFDLDERRHPTAAELDAAAPDHPVRLLHRTGHACVLNSRALRLAGITLETPEPPGGIIERDLDTGEPNGVLFEMGPFLNVRNVPPPLDAADLRGAVRLADRNLAALGVTAIHDATAGNGPADWELFANLQHAGELGTRITVMPGADSVADMADLGLHYGAGDDRLRVGPAKLVLDRSTGVLHPDTAVLREVVHLCAALGFPVALHAVEEVTVLAAVEAVRQCPIPLPPGVVHRIEHCSIAPPALLERMHGLPLAVVTQPGFLYHSAVRYREQMPPDEIPWLYRLRGFLDAGVPVALSTDCPVIPPDPGVTLLAALTRRGKNGDVLAPEEAMNFGEALAGMTKTPFRLSRPLGPAGLEPGAPADCVVLVDHPREAAAWQVRLTIRGGDIVHLA